jgi:hypothetical protein
MFAYKLLTMRASLTMASRTILLERVKDNPSLWGTKTTPPSHPAPRNSVSRAAARSASAVNRHTPDGPD